SWIGVPDAGSALATSVHRPAGPTSGAGGIRHACAGVLLQSQICSCTAPGVVLPCGTSRQRPEAGLTSAPVVRRCHSCPLAPLHVAITTGVALPVALPTIWRHLPSTRTVASLPSFTCCAAAWVHVASWTAVPSAVAPPRTSRHSPPAPSISPDTGLPAAAPVSRTVCAAATASAAVVIVTVRVLRL